MFSVKFTILLFFALLIPFLIKFFKPGLEPYPAIILPSGAGKAKVQNSTVTFQSRGLYGQRDDSTWQKVELSAFAYSIPIEYVYPCLFSNTGLAEGQARTENSIYKLLTNMGWVEKREIKEKDKTRFNTWIRSQLVKQGLHGTKLKLAEQTMVVALPSGSIIKHTTLNEKYILLD
jgi:hypothetical protein